MTDKKKVPAPLGDPRNPFTDMVDRLRKRQAWISQPNHPELAEIATDYAKRDYWLLREALNMAAGYHPSRSEWGKPGDYQLAASCVGPAGSLPVINQDEPQRKWRVRPEAFLEWAGAKGVPVHAAVRSAWLGVAPPMDATGPAKATEKKKAQAAQRQQLVASFIEQLNRKLTNYSWDSTAMPVTWEDVHRVFFRVNTKTPKVSIRTLADDFRALGSNCAPGRKSKENKVLDRLFGV